MFGPRMTPSGDPAGQVGDRLPALSVTVSDRLLAGKTPPAFPRPDR